VVVLEGWVSSLVAGGSALSGLKTLRILRPLRVANRLPALKKIITAMLSSLPAIFDTFVVFFFFLLIFAMLCVMLWQGTFHYRCRDDVTGEWVDTDTLCFPPQEPSGFCATLQFLDQPYTCEEGETCQAWTSTPEGGSLNFDNLGWSFLTLFTVSTMENWANVLYYTQNVMAEGTFFVFLVIILVGNFTIVNLMIAAILVQLDGATQSETAEKLAKINEKHEDRKRKKTGSLLTESEWSKVALVPMASEAANSRPTSPAASTQPPNEVVPPGGSTDTQQRMMGDCLRVTLSSIDYVTRTCVVPYSYDGLSRAGGSWGARLRSEVIADECMFSNFIQACIVFNLVVLAMDAHNIDAGTNYFLETANLVLTYIFFAEMVAKLAVGGILDYVGSRWNLFDAFIVFGSILELSLESGAGGSSLYALRLVRMLRLTRVARLARLAHKWKSLQTVIKLIIKSSSGMGPVLLLLVLFMFIFSILSMQIFGSFEFDDDFVRFDNFYVAFVQCFFVILGEAWVDILYITIEGSGSVLSSLYFVAIIVVGSFLLINLILAVVLGDSMPNKVQQEVGLKQMVYIFDTADLRHALGLWGWQVEVGKRVAERELALNAWQRLGIKLGGINAALSLGHCVGVSTEHLFAIRAHLDAGTVARVKLAAHAERTNVGDPVEKKIQLSIGGAPSESVDDGAMEVEAYSASSTFERKLSSSICSSRFGEGMPDCSGLDEVTGLPIEYDRKSWTELHATAKVVESFATALGLGVTLTQELQWRRNKDTALPNETSVDVSLASGPQDPINIADGATLTRWKEHAKFGEHRDAVLDLVSGKHNDRFSLTLGGRLVLPLEVQDQLLFSDGEIEAVRARFGAACVVERERIAKQASKLARSFRSRSSPERRASLGPGADVAASNPGGEDVLRMVGFKELVQQLTKVTVNGSDLQRPSNADINIAFNLADVVKKLESSYKEIRAILNLLKSLLEYVFFCPKELSSSRSFPSVFSFIFLITFFLYYLWTQDKSGSIDEIEFLKIFQMVKEGRVTGLAGGNMFHRPSSDVEEQRAAFINMMGGESYRSSPRSLSDGSESKGTGSIVDGDVEAAEHNDPGVIRKSGDSHSSSQPNSFDLSSFIDVNKNKHHAARNRRPSIRHRIQAKLAFTKQKVRLDLRSNKVAPERGLHRRSYSGKFELTASGEIVSVQAKLSRWRRYRRWASAFKIQKWFHDLVLLCIAVSCIIMVASSEDEDYTSWLFLVDTACGLVFMVELVVNVGASKTRPYPPRWPHGRDGFAAFWEDPWNRLDLAIVVSQCLAPVFRETSITLGLAACTVVKSCRPLRIINRIKDLKSTVVLLYSSMMRLGTMVVFLSFAMTAYAVIGMQLFKGLYFYCEDPSELETNKSYMANVGPFPHGTSRYGTLSSDGVTYSARPCTGAYVNAAGLSVVAQGVWRNPDYHFDDFPNAFLSVFVMSTENWAELVWQGLSAQEVDISGVPYGNTNPIAIFFFAFGISFFSLYMFNLFIGVVFDQYIEMSAIAKIQSDGKLVRKEDREWETYRERLSEVKPYAAAFQPTSKWRRQCGRLAVHPKFTNAILCVIALNAAALAVTHRGQSADLTAITEASNVAFAAVFALEVFVKISGFGAQRYFEDSVNIFDFTVTAVSLLDSVLYLLSICLSFDSAALRFVRSMRVFRLMRLVNLAPGCRNVMLALHYALPRLVNVAQLLLITVFFFANFGWVCFRSFGEHGSRYANFSTVFSSMQLLFVLMTGDNYTDTLGELMAAEPQYKIGTVLFFLVYMVVQYFVVVNLFVMVVCEAFEVLSEENRTTVEHFLPEFCKAW